MSKEQLREYVKLKLHREARTKGAHCKNSSNRSFCLVNLRENRFYFPTFINTHVSNIHVHVYNYIKYNKQNKFLIAALKQKINRDLKVCPSGPHMVLQFSMSKIVCSIIFLMKTIPQSACTFIPVIYTRDS